MIPRSRLGKGKGPASSSAAPSAPTILSAFRNRYKALKNCRVKKPERGFEFSTFPEYEFDKLLRENGLGGWLRIWDNKYCEELVLSFVTHLTYDKDTESFKTTVQGVEMDINIPRLCRRLQLSTEGESVYMSHYPEELREADLEIVMGNRYQESRRKKLYKTQLLPVSQLLSYITHFNVMPRGGMAIDEVPNSHLRFIACILSRRPIDYSAILSDIFTKLLDKDLKFLCYHKLITSICVTHGIEWGAWTVHQGPSIDAKRLKKMHLPTRPTDALPHESDESGDDGTDVGDASDRERAPRPSVRVQRPPPTGSAETPQGGVLDVAHFHSYMEAMESRLMGEMTSLRTQLEERDRISAAQISGLQAQLAGAEDRIYRRLCPVERVYVRRGPSRHGSPPPGPS